jgi:type III secretory pathway lipoprotein EscJ
VGTRRGIADVRTADGVRVGIAALSIALSAACAPTVDGPVERQRAADRDDADHLAAQLAALPGALTASVTIHRAVKDPLGVAAPSPASGVALIVVDDAANTADISRTARSLFVASAPELTSPAIEVVVGAHRPALASVGPFTVTESSASLLRIALGAALVLIAGLAGWIALRESRR